jgi:putative PIN family toxin of toxin-antitoxin system
MKVIFDVNVLISAAILRNSKPRLAFNKAIQFDQILISDDILNEFINVIFRTKFDKYLSNWKRIEFIRYFSYFSTKISISEKVTICQDPDDNKYLELASSADANYIITSDNDLLILNPFKNTKIITPDEFISIK